ncbi:MAG: methionyl-tRNA formyltransferase [Acidobacteria bacterium]|nr:methionyl-tRNA formyltransferase [Acidobacteriota bacterium]
MRIVFCGTPEFALPTLQRLIVEPDFSVETVITQPDRPRGRGQEVAASPVKDAALDAGIHVFQPEKIKSDSAFEFFKRLAPDVVVIIAYGQIVPARLLEIPRLGWINLHASLLPKYRGAAPINWAIVNGETRTGLTTMRIDPGMDTGPTLLRWETEILPDETAPELARRMAAAGPDLMVETLRKYDRGEIAPLPQDHSQASLAPMLKRENGRMDWSQPAGQIYNRIRGLDPWPGAFTTFRGHVCHIWGRPESGQQAAAPGILAVIGGSIFVSCGGSTSLRLEQVQLEGKKRIPARDWANGARLKLGEQFDQQT